MDNEIGIGAAGVGFPSLTTQLLTISILSLRRTVHHRAIQTQRPIQNSYDYIVVGSGTAGSVVAGRLSEDQTKTVLVLEAGGPQTVTSDSPSYARQQFGSYMDWAYRTTPQYPNAGNAYRDGGRVALPRGRIVGGSHNMNFLVYSRGNMRDYDRWAEEPINAKGWSYKDVLPMFLRSENNTDPRIVNANPELHSTSGPVVVQTPKTPDQIIEIIKQTLVADFNVPVTDQNGPVQAGISNFQQTIFLNGTRATTASCFLEANRNRTNLQVMTEAFVTKILFDNTSRSHLRATGVEYKYQGQTLRVYANREVILSAGSINSPQLMMLSGIGPRQHLKNLGIQPILDLPVGKNLQDHVYVQLDFEVLDQNLLTSGIDWNLKTMYENFALNIGPLTQFPLVVPVPNDLESLVAQYNPVYRNQWRDYYRPHLGQRNRLGILCFLYRPRSIGELRLQNSDPDTHPLMDVQYLTNQYDILAFTDSIRLAFMMVDESPILSKMLKPWQHPIPGCQLCASGKIYQCQPYLECYARALTATVGHQVGTARMAHPSNPTSVVDPTLKVIGTKNLRVADGSIMPLITNGNTNTPCMMIGEMAAKLIREENR